jgi:hypothetical protein
MNGWVMGDAKAELSVAVDVDLIDERITGPALAA